MVTVAIVGILGAIAIPIYNNYITKTRIADALTHGRVYAVGGAVHPNFRAELPALTATQRFSEKVGVGLRLSP